MNATRDSVLALQRHYLGALSTPARTWLEPLPATRLAFAGSAIRADREGCVIDFGTVDASDAERRTVRVFQPGDHPVAIRVDEVPDWLRTKWTEAGGVLAVRVTGDVEGERSGAIALWARDEHGPRREFLRVRIHVRPRHPLADIAFHGSPTPRPYDFGAGGGAYTIAVENRAAAPLTAAFADLPEWMEFEVDGCSRRGPLAGRFFERTAPFRVTLRPRLLGRRTGSLRMQTNDVRPELRDVELQFAACVTPARPHLRVIAPPPFEALPSSEPLAAGVRLENWGRSPARVTCQSRTPAIAAAPTVVPSARDGEPGTAVLPVQILPAQLPAGVHALAVELHVDGGEPADVRVVLHVTVAAAASRQRRQIRPEMIAALFALLLLTAVLFVAARGLP